MKKIFVIGGMGAGKSTARRALVEQGLPFIDLDKVGHDVLHWEIVKEELAGAFGNDIFDNEGEVDRAYLAKKAFDTPANTRKLNRITMPRIEELYSDQVKELEKEGAEAVVVEYSVFTNRDLSIAYDADIVMAILAPLEIRIERAVAGGWDEMDVRHRIARQISDAERVDSADVVFDNDKTPEELAAQVVEWWNEYRKTF